MDDYKQVFDGYIAEMRETQAAAQGWWEALTLREQQLSGDAEQAQQALDARWPLGAVSHPFVIATFRKWALECQALNDEADADEEEADDTDESGEADWGIAGFEDEDSPQDLAMLAGPIEPRELLIEMLPGRADDLAEFLAEFVFTPLGLDADDRWI